MNKVSEILETRTVSDSWLLICFCDDSGDVDAAGDYFPAVQTKGGAIFNAVLAFKLWW